MTTVLAVCRYELMVQTKRSWKPHYVALLMLSALFAACAAIGNAVWSLCALSEEQNQEVITCVLRSLSHELSLVSLEPVLEDLRGKGSPTICTTLASAACSPNLFT